MVLDHHERIVRLEGRDELIAEKAKSASMAAVVQISSGIHEKLSQLQLELNILKGDKPPPQIAND